MTPFERCAYRQAKREMSMEEEDCEQDDTNPNIDVKVEELLPLIK